MRRVQLGMFTHDISNEIYPLLGSLIDFAKDHYVCLVFEGGEGVYYTATNRHGSILNSNKHMTEDTIFRPITSVDRIDYDTIRPYLRFVWNADSNQRTSYIKEFGTKDQDSWINHPLRPMAYSSKPRIEEKKKLKIKYQL